MDYSYIFFVVGRLVFGGYFLFAASNHFMRPEMLSAYAASKGVPAPKAAVLGSGLLLVAGGLGVLLWMYVAWAAAALILFLLPVTFKMHTFWSVADQNAKMTELVNFTKNLVLLGAAFMILAFFFTATPAY